MKNNNISVFAVSESFQDAEQIKRWALCLHFPNFSYNKDVGAWVVLGDFNTIRYDMERMGGRPCISSFMAEFNDCINKCGLLDLSFEGRQLSWCNGYQGLARSWAKIDRVLINNEFVTKYGGAMAYLLNRNTSDHAPILLQFVVDMERYIPAPFHFQNMWISHVGFLDVVGNSWNKPMVSESGLHRLVGKLKNETKA
ncbi:hypothetical protein Ddye_027089 [Dipteronia dyeriana]|uniref:Uncharacterized protein n=1 Tax=Dipteronia dyeriana TaxID=168575 RepID=A0AAD9TNE9_9ROSI|nr:hypothetical protein Ddye_027089 [Dipteronia dyeriana]